MGHSRRIAVLAAGLLVGLSACDTGTPVQNATGAVAANHQDRLWNHSAGKTMMEKVHPASVTSTNGTYFLLMPLAILRFNSARGLVNQPQ